MMKTTEHVRESMGQGVGQEWGRCWDRIVFGKQTSVSRSAGTFFFLLQIIIADNY